jgi:hypothetical protein
LQRAGMIMRKILPKLPAFDQQVDNSFWKDKKGQIMSCTLSSFLCLIRVNIQRKCLRIADPVIN